MSLTAKQQKFADNYIECGNQTKAALDAGYSKRTAASIGNENLKKPEIKKYIDERMKEIESAKIAKADEVLKLYTSVLRAEITETVAVGTPDGVDKAQVPPSIKDRLAAGRELMKRYPTDDPLVEQQLRKLRAEAKLAESKLQTDEQQTPQITIYDSWGRE
ncbi:terminase small subunit [Tetragenococcus halophilus]|uniref:Terminase small subunit n=1 Tax=Tetragenococcus halophilus TaxID=51669 RepID=A0AB35HM28_TETHA|nr:terminase small subunit [Tetragenococcus halophilus]MCO8288298.1 terminase small subunit [Tetragenococcus halophilus]MCO8290249.1 terminase small subunit [Tetragenococcus halophilus]MCO8294680.1 terminase small subunit [Tetragenococcus halophilus]MCO8297307.1 terminase small subunit [Tetragenococcus halophilus]